MIVNISQVQIATEFNMAHMDYNLRQEEYIKDYYTGMIRRSNNIEIIFSTGYVEETLNTAVTSFLSNYINYDFNPEDYRIYDYCTDNVKTKEAQAIDYKVELDSNKLETGALIPSRTFHFGELQEVIWYADSAHQIPVLKVEIIYTRTGTGIAVSRVTNRYWYKKNGEFDLLKTTSKTYGPIDMMEEMYTRRRNVVSDAIITAVYILSLVYPEMDHVEREDIGKNYIGDRQDLIDRFINSGTKDLLNNITADTTTVWMNAEIAPGVTLRTTLMYKLDIWNNS